MVARVRNEEGLWVALTRGNGVIEHDKHWAPNKQSLGLEAEVQIDFSKNSDGTLTIVEKFEKKTKRVTGGNLLDDLIK